MPLSSEPLPPRSESSRGSAPAYRRHPRHRDLDAFLERVRVFDPDAVILFGSLARGDFTQHSDADVLVIASPIPDWVEVYACGEGWVQPVVRTLDEVLHLVGLPEPFYLEILEDGILLLEWDGTGETLRQSLAAAKQRHAVRRFPGGWRWGASRDDQPEVIPAGTDSEPR
jgi:uncharacterized protein